MSFLPETLTLHLWDHHISQPHGLTLCLSVIAMFLQMTLKFSSPPVQKHASLLVDCVAQPDTGLKELLSDPCQEAKRYK